MPWEPDLIEDGEAATAARINGVFTDASDYVNDLDRAGLRRHCFNHYHAYQVITEVPADDLTFEGDSGYHVYTIATFGASLTYAAFGQDGGSSSGADIGSGDRVIVGHPSETGSYSGSGCVINLNSGTGYKVGMANGERCGAILCMFNCEIVKATRGDATDFEIMFCLQYRLNGAGTWFTIGESERFVSYTDHVLDI